MAMPKKGIALAILDKLPPPGKMKAGGKEAEPADDEEGDIGLESAAADLIAAVKKGDAKAVAAALKDAYEMC